MITKNKKIIAIHPWESIKELLIVQAIKAFGEKTGMSSSKAIRFMENLERGGVITEDIAETLENGGIGCKSFWLNLQKRYNEKCDVIRKYNHMS